MVRGKVSLGRRYRLRGRETKQLLSKISKTLKLDISGIIDEGARIEVVELTTEGEVILVDDRASFIQLEDEVLPTLLNEAILRKLPSITVDTGAVPHICNGADLMAPGILRIDGEFDVGAVLFIVEERFSKGIAIAKALCNSTEAAEQRSGKVAVNLHFVGDSFWEAFKLM